MPRRRLLLLLPLLALVLGGCGTKGIDLPQDESEQVVQGAEVFYNRCAACHTLDAVGSEGSSVNVTGREYKDGPNFNQRAETAEQVLYAIRNGGYSSGPMPQNIVVGEEAEAVAAFVEKYSGRQAARAPTPKSADPAGVPGSQNEAGTPGGESTGAPE